MRTEQNNSFVVIAVLIGGIIVGFVIGAGVARSRAGAQMQKLQAQIERAKEFFPSLPQEIRTISGTVKEVNAGEHIVIMEVSVANPFDESPTMRRISIGPDTKITRAEAKDPASYQREIAEFQKAVRTQSGKSGFFKALTPPDPFREVASTIADIHPGAHIMVTADSNIRDQESFTATAIRILEASGANGPFGAPASGSR